MYVKNMTCNSVRKPVPFLGLPFPQVPVNLLRASRVFVFEPPPGVKANLLRTFSAVPAPRMCKVRT